MSGERRCLADEVPDAFVCGADQGNGGGDGLLVPRMYGCLPASQLLTEDPQRVDGPVGNQGFVSSCSYLVYGGWAAPLGFLSGHG